MQNLNITSAKTNTVFCYDINPLDGGKTNTPVTKGGGGGRDMQSLSRAPYSAVPGQRYVSRI